MHKSEELRADLISKIVQQVHKKLDKEEAKLVEAFAHQFYGGVSNEDLKERTVSDLYGAMLSQWKMIQQHNKGQTLIQVYNPNHEQHGWQAGHTVIAIVTDNRPFLVDSVRMALNNLELTTHFIVHMSTTVSVNDAGQVASIPASKNDKSHKCVAPILLEVDRQTSPEFLAKIQSDLTEVLDDVDVAVEDWKKIVAKAKGIVSELDEQVKANPKDKKVKEAREFINWMVDHHFTFLGCQDLELETKGKLSKLSLTEGSGLGLLRENRTAASDGALLAKSDKKLLLSEPLIIAKSNLKSTIHRPAYMDYIAVKRYDKNGEVIGERRFLGLYTSSAYNSSPETIPILRQKVDYVLKHSGLSEVGHSGKALLNILETYPRDELFQIEPDGLAKICAGILQMQERKLIKLFARKDVFGRFVSFLVFVPRERYDTDLREAFQSILCDAVGGSEVEFSTVLSESVLARTLFVVHVDPQASIDIDIDEVNRKLVEASRTWSDILSEALVEHFGEEQGNELLNKFGRAFPISYQHDFEPRTAVYDIKHINSLKGEGDVGMSFYRPLEAPEGEFRFKLFRKGKFISLSDVLPMLENMGLHVQGEYPYKIANNDEHYWLHDFRISHERAEALDPDEVKDIFQDAFANLWFGRAENDGFNRLVLGAGINWRETALLRAYAKYLRQIGFTFSQTYIEETLANNGSIAVLLVDYFKTLFEPDARKKKTETLEELESQFFAALDEVSNRDEDRILRRYLDIIKATIRTNFFQNSNNGNPKSYISFKFEPSKIPDIPLPCPVYEIFVYSPRVEGVHLRGGKVARGGLRWSDRREDFRTEILGLVKAQQVKNSVIVPVGAKGGFVPKCLPVNGSRDEIMAEGVACYKTFIRGLLDITDNLKGDKVIPPRDVIRLDADDPYMVVAADKGTATFSDTANEIAKEYDFWLGDAFASGGSVGYDHKKMGITARGAWESVKRHFREMGIDIQSQDFTAVGVGDMAGDVFGNGMLLSKHIKLVGAFNHMHIFIDPNPDAASSYKERERMFNLPRSSWEDYNAKLISKGGGIFRRSAKSILLTPEIKKLLDLKVDTIEPNDLISALLKARVDLLWNGGIGTYVKAASESHDDVGDRANDSLRINGGELRCQVVGEGGNLGLTQLGRIEAALRGVRVNTDFIDNVGGVDCSDHEVNIKILLNDLVANGDMTEKQRDALLVEMTDEVSALVLHNNYRQTQALSIAYKRALVRLEHHIRLIHELERQGKLDRQLEGLPTDEELKERKLGKTALTVPEISVLLAYTKNVLQEELLESTLPDDNYYVKALESAFPVVLREKFSEPLKSHKLRREIISTQLVNNMINKMGASFVLRLKDETGTTAPDITRCYSVAREIFNMSGIWKDIESLDNKVSADVQMNMMLDVMRLVRRATRWFLRNYRKGLDIGATIAEFAPLVSEIGRSFAKTLPEDDTKLLALNTKRYTDAGVPSALAKQVAGLRALFPALDIIKAANTSGVSVQEMSAIYFSLGERLNVQWFHDQIASHTAENHWESLAVAAFRDDLDYQQSMLASEVAHYTAKGHSVDAKIDAWVKENAPFVKQWKKMVSESSASGSLEFAMFAVAIRELTDLVQLSGHASDDKAPSGRVALQEVKKTNLNSSGTHG